MKFLYPILIAMGFLFPDDTFAQCGGSEFCNGNTGLYSNDEATNIAYDNMGSAYHSSYIKEPNGEWRVWGANMANNGSNVLSPRSVNVLNYSNLTGTIYKMAIGSVGSTTQLIVLTSTGLFAGGSEGKILSASITSSDEFQKITVNGKIDGLPLNVGPLDVKMLFASSRTLMITTCSGEVHVLSQNTYVRGNGGSGDPLTWSKVMKDENTPLSNIIVARGNPIIGFALKSDGTIWTWGSNTYLGDASQAANRNFATQMALPSGLAGIKMIQATISEGSEVSYYMLGTDKKIYALGANVYGQLGDRTAITRTAWVNAKNPDNTIITDAAWISSNEHDSGYPGLGVIKNTGTFYTAGNNSYFMLGLTFEYDVNYLALPAGIVPTNVITHAEVGGHSTAVIKLGSPRYGYVGHRVSGSMGDGTALDETQETFDFVTPPVVAVCGTLCTQPVVTTNGPICPGSNAVFTIIGTPGDIVTYSVNSGSAQTVSIEAGGSVSVSVANALVNQQIQLTYILGGTGACSNFLSTTATILISSNITPEFTKIGSICSGDNLSPLPKTSNNGVEGTWSPALSNSQTQLYTFTPNSSSCATTTTMTITVHASGTVPSFTQVAPICTGDVLNPLPTTSNEGISGIWSPALNNTQTTTYTFTPSVMNSCSQITTMTIQVLSGMLPVFTQVAPVCIGDNMSPLPFISNNGITGSWSPIIDNLQTTTYTFTPAPGSCAQIIQMTIVVNPKATPSFTQVAPICEGSPLATLPVASDNSIAGSWSPTMNNFVTTTYTFTPNTGICASIASMTITVIPKVKPNFVAVAPLCYADPGFTLPTVSIDGISGTWSPVFNNTQTTPYTFTPDADECAFFAGIKVHILDDFDFELSKYCLNGNLMLQVVPKAESFLVDSASFAWTHSSASVGINSVFNVTAFLNSTAAGEALPIYFDIAVTDANGCSKKQTIRLDNVYCDIQKGISPNNDSKNDFFDLRLLDVKHLSIFNRYGMEVYSKQNYYDEWHGQTNEGSILPDATYYYVIDFNNEPSKTGWIYVNNQQ